MNIISCFRGALQAALCLSVLSSCSGALTGSSYEVRTPLSSTGIRLEGLGVELDPHFISQNLLRHIRCHIYHKPDTFFCYFILMYSLYILHHLKKFKWLYFQFKLSCI